MPREVLIVSPRPVDIVDLVAVGMPDDAAIRSLWETGAWQLLDPEGQTLVTILRSRTIETASDLGHWGWEPPEGDERGLLFLTEIYLAAADAADRLSAALSSTVGGVILSGAAPVGGQLR